ncbi:MAG: sporulation protein YqfD, partial [Clostridiales bacterium]
VLISGQVGKLQMAAAGLITADIWAEGYGECPRTISGIKETGANVSGIGIRLSDGPVLTIWGESRSPYALFQRKEQVASVFLWRKMALPVEIIISQYNEQTAFTEHLSVETAYRRAEAAAMAAALVLLPEQAAIAETHAEDISLDQQLLRVHVRLRACYDLGRFQQGIDAEAAERGARQAAEQAVL